MTQQDMKTRGRETWWRRKRRQTAYTGVISTYIAQGPFQVEELFATCRGLPLKNADASLRAEDSAVRLVCLAATNALAMPISCAWNSALRVRKS